MDLLPPTFESIEEARAWCHQLYLELLYPGKFQCQYIELQELTTDEITDLGTPEDSRVRLYAEDAGSDKTKISAKFYESTETVATES